VAICSVCDEVIDNADDSPIMLAVGMKCHDICFACKFCFEPLDKATATLKDGKLSCVKCLMSSEDTAPSAEEQYGVPQDHAPATPFPDEADNNGRMYDAHGADSRPHSAFDFPSPAGGVDALDDTSGGGGGAEEWIGGQSAAQSAYDSMPPPSQAGRKVSPSAGPNRVIASSQQSLRQPSNSRVPALDVDGQYPSSSGGNSSGSSQAQTPNSRSTVRTPSLVDTPSTRSRPNSVTNTKKGNVRDHFELV